MDLNGIGQEDTVRDLCRPRRRLAGGPALHTCFRGQALVQGRAQTVGDREALAGTGYAEVSDRQ